MDMDPDINPPTAQPCIPAPLPAAPPQVCDSSSWPVGDPRFVTGCPGMRCADFSLFRRGENHSGDGFLRLDTSTETGRRARAAILASRPGDPPVLPALSDLRGSNYYIMSSLMSGGDTSAPTNSLSVEVVRLQDDVALSDDPNVPIVALLCGGPPPPRQRACRRTPAGGGCGARRRALGRPSPLCRAMGYDCVLSSTVLSFDKVPYMGFTLPLQSYGMVVVSLAPTHVQEPWCEPPAAPSPLCEGQIPGRRRSRGSKAPLPPQAVAHVDLGARHAPGGVAGRHGRPGRLPALRRGSLKHQCSRCSASRLERC